MHPELWKAPALDRTKDPRREADQVRIVRRPGGWSLSSAGDRSRSEPLTTVGKRLLRGLLGAGSADSFHTVRMPSGHSIKVEDATDLR